MSNVEIKPQQGTRDASVSVAQKATPQEVLDFQKTLQRRLEETKSESHDDNKEPLPEGSAPQITTLRQFLSFSHEESHKGSQEENGSESPMHAAELPVGDRIKTRPLSTPSAINNGELSESLKEYMLTNSSQNDGKIHLSFSDRLSPVSEMMAQHNANGKITLRLTAQSYEGKRIESQIDQLRRRLLTSGLDIDDITLTTDGEVRAAVARDPRSGA